MIQKTRWHYDTCDCVIDVEWDDTQDMEIRTHSVFKIIKACAVHYLQPNKEVHYAVVKEENNMKNKIFGIIENDYPDLLQATTFSFDKDRILQIDNKLLNITQKSTLINKFKMQFGIGKVEII